MSSTTHNGVELAIADGVARVTLASPGTRNALSLELASAMRDALRQASASPSVNAIVLRAKGDLFSVGGDLNAFREAPMGANLNDLVARPINEAIETITDARQPVICAVQGSVGGGAIGLVLATDISLAVESAAFRMGYTASGLSPDCGVTWFLPRYAGMAAALDLMLTNRRFTAAEALQLGLISRVVRDDGLEECVDQVISALRRVPTAALAETKRLARRAFAADLHSQLDDEARTIGRLGDTTETREVIAAFLDKREPTPSF